jgi:cysteine desulfurase
VAELIGAPSRDVIFTSCATESNNTAIAAALRATGVPPVQGQLTRVGRPWHAKRHIVTSQVEHSSVQNYCMALEKTPLLIQEGCPKGGVVTEGAYRVTYLPVDREGLLNLADLEAALTDETAVVSLMWANNETGVLFPVDRIEEICQSRGVLYHCDAVQAAGKVEIDVRKVPADCLSLTGHKFHAPKSGGKPRSMLSFNSI